MFEKAKPKTEKELEAWRAEVARGNEEARRGPRPSLRRAAGELATRTEAAVPIEEPESTSLGNQPVPTVRNSDSTPH